MVPMYGDSIKNIVHAPRPSKSQVAAFRMLMNAYRRNREQILARKAEILHKALRVR